jgi:glycosyltransferase involved in cell wall biosynthesis
MEAMAMGKAIVSTSVGAEGFPVVSGQELVLADDPSSFGQEVLDLLDSPARRAELGQTGKAFAQTNYSWDVLIPRLEQVYQQNDRQPV